MSYSKLFVSSCNALRKRVWLSTCLIPAALISPLWHCSRCFSLHEANQTSVCITIDRASRASPLQTCNSGGVIWQSAVFSLAPYSVTIATVNIMSSKLVRYILFHTKRRQRVSRWYNLNEISFQLTSTRQLINLISDSISP